MYVYRMTFETILWRFLCISNDFIWVKFMAQRANNQVHLDVAIKIPLIKKTTQKWGKNTLQQQKTASIDGNGFVDKDRFVIQFLKRCIEQTNTHKNQHSWIFIKFLLLFDFTKWIALKLIFREYISDNGSVYALFGYFVRISIA